MFVLHFGEWVYSLRELWSSHRLCQIVLNVDASIIDRLIHRNTRLYEQTGWIVNHGYNPVTTLLIEAVISFKIVSVLRERRKERKKKMQEWLVDSGHHVCPPRWRESLFFPWTLIITIFSTRWSWTSMKKFQKDCCFREDDQLRKQPE